MNTHHDDHLAKRVLDRIEGERLTPRPRWEFLFKNYVFWSIGAVAVALGAVAVSAILFEVANVDWRLASATHGSFWQLLLAAAPYLWALVLIAFMLIGYLNVRRTSRGYRYRLLTIALGAVLTSVSLGSMLYLAGVGGVVERSLGDHPPFYRPIIAREDSWWLAPEKGLLSGEIVSVAPEVDSFIIRDPAGTAWQVDGDDLPPRGRAVVARGGLVRIVGVPLSATSSLFHACFVFPREPKGDMTRDPLPPPLAALASTSERESPHERSAECRGIRPYAPLHALDD